MRLTEDRYSNERLYMEVALRMIRLEARTCTIRACTGLSEDRIRKLFNSYIEPGSDGIIRRRRGKSPQQITCFTQNIAAELATSILAGVFASCGLLNGRSFSNSWNLQFGALMCDAYEFYRELDPDSPLSFEHAWFLLKSLHTNQDLSVERCLDCGGLHVQEHWAVRRRSCPLCRMQSAGTQATTRREHHHRVARARLSRKRPLQISGTKFSSQPRMRP
jgi:hypothetical protein